jgi:WD40-like Beta Propeller Repeat
MVGRVFVAVTVVSILAAVSPDRARGSFPGENGRLVLSWFHETEEDLPPAEDLATVDSTGSDFRVIDSCEYECYFNEGDWSPSGHRIVYAADWDDAWGIVSVRADGTRSRVIRRSGFAFFSSPVWSPDGRRIAFVREPLEYGRTDIYVMDSDGHGAGSGAFAVSKNRPLGSVAPCCKSDNAPHSS